MLRTKKLSALFLVVAVMASIFATALPAWAAPLATATRTSSAALFPGQGQSAAIRVTNNSVGGPVASPLLGERINAVQIILPTGTAGITNDTSVPAPTPANWTVQRISAGNLQTLTFKASNADAAIASGSNLTFNLPINVAQPASSDRAGNYQVQVSSDAGATSTGVTQASSVLSTVVRVLEITDVAATSPAGAADGNGTAGQAITMGVTLRNHAANAITVDPSLTSNNDTDAITDNHSATSVPANLGTTTVSFPVTLGGASSDRNTQFTGDGSGDNIDGVHKQLNYVVQVAPNVNLTASSFSPQAVRPHPEIQYTFTINSTKTGTPALGLTSGNFHFANEDAALQLPVDYAGSGSAATLRFGPITVSADNVDDVYDGIFSFSGNDGNGKSFTQEITLTDLITIDSIAPVITAIADLPNDDEGDPQTAAKDADTIDVSGTIDDSSATIDLVQIQDNAGGTFDVPVTRTGNNYSGSRAVTFNPAASKFWVYAKASDGAGNPGEVNSTTLEVDNLEPTAVEAKLLDVREVSVKFDDGLNSDGSERRVRGGCNLSQWRVQGNVVTAVSYSDGTPCQDSQAGPDNYRLLTLAQAEDRDSVKPVTYTPVPLARDQAKDGAGNFTDLTVLEWVSQIAPDAPTIQAVERNAGTETATFDEDKYWTRFGGEDLTVDFAGGRANYTIIVRDGNGNILREEPMSTSTGTVLVPIGTAEGTYTRSLQLRGTNNLLSELTTFLVELDQTAPLIQGAVKTATGEVNVTFTESLWEGTNFSFDWYGYEQDAAGERYYYAVDQVAGTGNQRTLSGIDWADVAPFGGADYVFGGGGSRYRDRAGNNFGDTTVFDGS